MINLSKLISNIKMDLGVVGMASPFENLDELIKEIISVKTLPIFSEISPYKVPLFIKLDTLKLVERRSSGSTVYELPDVFGDKQILMIIDIEPSFDNDKSISHNSTAYTYGISPCTFTYQDLMLAQANSNVMSAMVKKPTCNFIPPNRIELFDQYGFGDEYRLEIGLEHAENLSTISATSYSSFLSLAMLDVKKYMYDNLKHYNELSTAYGSLSLKLDDWSGAEGERQQLIEKWHSTYHLDLNTYIMI